MISFGGQLNLTLSFWWVWHCQDDGLSHVALHGDGSGIYDIGHGFEEVSGYVRRFEEGGQTSELVSMLSCPRILVWRRDWRDVSRAGDVLCRHLRLGAARAALLSEPGHQTLKAVNRSGGKSIEAFSRSLMKGRKLQMERAALVTKLTPITSWTQTVISWFMGFFEICWFFCGHKLRWFSTSLPKLRKKMSHQLWTMKVMNLTFFPMGKKIAWNMGNLPKKIMVPSKSKRKDWKDSWSQRWCQNPSKHNKIDLCKYKYRIHETSFFFRHGWFDFSRFHVGKYAQKRILMHVPDRKTNWEPWIMEPNPCQSLGVLAHLLRMEMESTWMSQEVCKWVITYL